jgi:hypothetical protein
VSLELAPGQQAIVNGGELFGAVGSDLVVGSVQLEAPAGVAASALVGEATRKRVLTGIPLYQSGFLEGVFPHLASGTVGGISYFTGLAFQNTATSGAIVEIQVYSADGVLKRHRDLIVPAGGRYSGLLTELFADLESLVGGHIRVTSSVPIGMIEVFGNDNLEFLTTVPPSIVR